jgi:tRNA G18 (ribose-2'-O)-methylase SpoU
VSVRAPGARKSPSDLRQQRRSRQHSCWDHLIVAPLWVAYEANLGTLLRTCDAVGACIAVPPTPDYRRALRRGDTLVRRPCTHWVDRKQSWLRRQHERGARIVGVELADDATRLADLAPASQLTVVVLGHSITASPMRRGSNWTRSWRFQWWVAGRVSTSPSPSPDH